MHEHESGLNCGMENTWSCVDQVSNKFVLGVLHLGQTNFGVGGEIANNS